MGAIITVLPPRRNIIIIIIMLNLYRSFSHKMNFLIVM